jgi:hypothetical protein
MDGELRKVVDQASGLLRQSKRKRLSLGERTRAIWEFRGLVEQHWRAIAAALAEQERRG